MFLEGDYGTRHEFRNPTQQHLRKVTNPTQQHITKLNLGEGHCFQDALQIWWPFIENNTVWVYAHPKLHGEVSGRRVFWMRCGR